MQQRLHRYNRGIIEPTSNNLNSASCNDNEGSNNDESSDAYDNQTSNNHHDRTGW